MIPYLNGMDAAFSGCPRQPSVLETAHHQHVFVLCDVLYVRVVVCMCGAHEVEGHAPEAPVPAARFIEPAVGKSEDEVLEEKLDSKENDEAMYIISVGRRRRGAAVDCLHKKDGCWRARTLNFSSFEYVTIDPPLAASYSSVRKHCWPSGDPGFDAEEDLGNTDGDSSDEDSDLNFDPNSGTEESADQD